MTNEQILKQAIEKAIRNKLYENKWWEQDKKPLKVRKFEIDGDIITFYIRNGFTEISKFEFIFSHDFAKAFWGDGYTMEEHSKKIGRPAYFFSGLTWQYNLQMMVLEKEPLKYIKKWL